MLLNIISYTIINPDILNSLIYYLPDATQSIFIGFIDEITQTSSQSLLSIAAVLGIWSASAGIKAVIKAINNAYDYIEDRSYIKLRLMAVFFTIALLFLIVLVFLTLIFGEVLGNMVFKFLGISHFFKTLWAYVRILIPLSYMIFMFAMLYKFSPCRSRFHRVKFLSALPGAIFTTFGWLIISILFSYYVNNFGRYAITYGSLVGVILLYIWLYITSIIIVLGGEINATLEYFKMYGFQLDRDKSVLIKAIDKS